ncbi:MAG: ankyrin repeat domain-containing protein, partial [Longimicrobiales bacterium]
KLAGILGLSLLAAATPPESPVADAAMRGDVDAVRSLLKQGADVNAPHGDGMTALHWAAENGDPSLADILIDARADLEAQTRIGHYTPLHLASRGGHAAVVRGLLEAGAEPGAVTTTGGSTPLHFAAGAGSAEAVTALLDHGSDINARESVWGQTPLMFAAAYDRIAALKVLLARGADVTVVTNVVDLPAREAVDDAANQRRDSVLEAFHEKDGANDPNWKPAPSQVQAAVSAAQEVQRKGVQAEPVEKVPDPSGGEEVLGFSGLVGSWGGLTALLHAAREGHVEAVVALLDAGADINAVSAGDQTSPLLIATINGHFDLAQLLLERGADPDLASDAGATPLYVAINTHWAPHSRYPQQHAYMLQKSTYLDLMKVLLEAGADPNVRLKKHLWYMSYTFDLLDVDTRGATPFWRAAYATDVEAMKLLVSHGANPNVPTLKPPERRRRGGRDDEQREDPSGLPPVPPDGPAVWPIHAASGVGYGEGYAGNAHRHVPGGWLPAVKYLVEELGADVNARDHNGYNPVHHAAARGDNELILYLVEKGADVTAVSRRGQTTADMANGPVQRISPFPETVALLEKLGSKNNHRCMSC